MNNSSKAFKNGIRLMKKTNPQIIPRNHIVEKTLKAADEGDFKGLQRFVDVLKKPYKNTLNNSEYKKTPRNDERVYQTFCGT